MADRYPNQFPELTPTLVRISGGDVTVRIPLEAIAKNIRNPPQGDCIEVTVRAVDLKKVIEKT